MKMKFLLLLILIVGASGLSYGMLSNDINMNIQKWDILSLPPIEGDPLGGPGEYTTFSCSCDGGICNVDYLDSPTNSIPDPASLGLSGNKLCT